MKVDILFVPTDAGLLKHGGQETAPDVPVVWVGSVHAHNAADHMLVVTTGLRPFEAERS
jgi:hypothetical protein